MRNVNRETTYQWKCDICGKEDLCLYSNGKDNPYAPEGWTWLLGFQYDQEPRLELSYKAYGTGHTKIIPLSDKVEKVEPLLVCLFCTKSLKSLVKEAKPSLPQTETLEYADKRFAEAKSMRVRAHRLNVATSVMMFVMALGALWLSILRIMK